MDDSNCIQDLTEQWALTEEHQQNCKTNLGSSIDETHSFFDTDTDTVTDTKPLDPNRRKYSF